MRSRPRRRSSAVPARAKPTSERGWELVEHTADEGLHVWAPTLEEVFAEAAVALIEVMGTATGDPARESVSLESSDLDGLFVDWLSEVLFLFDARAFVPHEITVRIVGTRLEATLDGVKATAFEQEGPAVKAVTYHGLELSDTEARVYIDV